MHYKDKKIQEDSNGKIIITEKEYFIKVDTESFYMTFLKFMKTIYNIDSAVDFKILYKFCEIAEFNTGIVNLSPKLRIDICLDLQINVSNFSKSIKRLKEQGIISGDKGQYLINPALFWKGTMDSRNKILKENGLSITFSIANNEENFNKVSEPIILYKTNKKL